MAYGEELDLPTSWCKNNKLYLNIGKLKEVIVDFLTISGTTGKRVSKTQFLGV